MAGGAGQQRARQPDGYGNYPQQPQNYQQGPLAPQFRQHAPQGSNNYGASRPLSGGYDGPGEPSRRPQGPPQCQQQGRPQLPPGFQQQGPAQGGSQGPARQNLYAPGLGYDPAKPDPVKPKVITNTRIELPASAYKLEGPGYEFPSELPKRPGTNTNGKAIQIRVNQFKVTQWPPNDIWQYDVQIGNGAEKRGLIKVVWESRAVQDRIRSLIKGPWIWDGNKLAWCAFNIPEQRILVDLDAERGRQPQPGRENKVYCLLRPTKPIRMAVIQGYLSGYMQFDNTILEAISFLDHVMRQWPSEQYTQIKRSFFSRGNTSFQLDNCIVAMKGVYTSIRLCDPKSSVGAPSTGLALNVDVANGTFWASQDLHQAARNYCKDRNRQLSYTVFRDLLKPVNHGNGVTQSEDFKNLRKMAKLKFLVKHRGKAGIEKVYTIKGFTFDGKDAKYFVDGMNAKNTSFTLKPKPGVPGREREEVITVYNYYKRQYKIDLQFWFLPLVQTSRDGMFPMELCVLLPNQRYNYKLSPDQTAAMIKFAVTRPKERIASIQHGIGMLKWHEDKYLGHFGIKVDPNMTMTNARLLQNPEIQFDRAKLNPGTSGRWDLRGKKFLFGNPEPLKSWGVVIVGGCTNEQTVRNFLNVFIQTYIGHGGRVENKNPVIYTSQRGQELGDAVVAARMAAGDQSQALPQILLFVMPGRDSFMYERLKKNMECRFAMVSQMVNIAHVVKAAPQYCSNVCMKVNAKLGGATSKVFAQQSFFKVPTMIIGADVSHPSPGSQQASMAALTMSFDRDACRYAAAVQTNGYRVEMITTNNIQSMVMPLFDRWITKVGGGKTGPAHIYYFRDGVSEGQYAHVLNQEVSDMKKAIAAKYPNSSIKWTVTVCTKRHHIRFFPKDNDGQVADKNNNPLPGTLVERDVTHPFEYDFYLNSHSAIQGTARPVHYHVILDEANVAVNDFQKMVYQHSYQYMRSTTPVSLYPAVYYAHLASNRARAHESAPASDGPRGGQKFEEAQQDAAGRRTVPGTSNTGSTPIPEARPLLPLGNTAQGGDLITKIRTGMWYI